MEYSDDEGMERSVLTGSRRTFAISSKDKEWQSKVSCVKLKDIRNWDVLAVCAALGSHLRRKCFARITTRAAIRISFLGIWLFTPERHRLALVADEELPSQISHRPVV